MKIMRISASSKGDCDLHPHMDSWLEEWVGFQELMLRKRRKLKLFLFLLSKEKDILRTGREGRRKNSSSTNPIQVIISTHLDAVLLRDTRVQIKSHIWIITPAKSFKMISTLCCAQKVIRMAVAYVCSLLFLLSQRRDDCVIMILKIIHAILAFILVLRRKIFL